MHGNNSTNSTYAEVVYKPNGMCNGQIQIFENMHYDIHDCQTDLVNMLCDLGLVSFDINEVDRDCIEWFSVEASLGDSLAACGYVVLKNDYGCWWGSNIGATGRRGKSAMDISALIRTAKWLHAECDAESDQLEISTEDGFYSTF